MQGNIIWNILPELKWEMTGAFSKTTTTANLWADDHSYAVSKIRGANYGELVTSEKDAWLALASALPYGGILNYNFTEQQSFSDKDKADLYKIADALPKEMDGLAKKLHLDKQRLSDMPMLMMKIYVTRL